MSTEKTVEEIDYQQLTKDLRIKSDTIAMGERIAYGSDSGIMDAAADAIEALTQLVKEVEVGAFEEAIKLSDEIERAEPDGGTRQWMAFKRFRNTLRDRLTHTTSDVIEK